MSAGFIPVAKRSSGLSGWKLAFRLGHIDPHCPEDPVPDDICTEYLDLNLGIGYQDPKTRYLDLGTGSLGSGSPFSHHKFETD